MQTSITRPAGCYEVLCKLRLVQLSTYLLGINYAHVHASITGVVQEGAVKCPPHGLIASEGESYVGNPTTDLAAWALLLDLGCGVDEVNRIIVVLRHAGADSKDVGVKDDVLRVKAHLIDQNLVCPSANADLVLGCCSLKCSNTNSLSLLH